MTKVSLDQDNQAIVLDSEAVYVGEKKEGKEKNTEGSKLHFRGAKKNTDQQWIARMDDEGDISHLRICMGDNDVEDSVEIGYADWKNDYKWTPVFRVKATGDVYITGDLHVEGAIKPTNGLRIQGDVAIHGNLEAKNDLTLSGISEASSQGHSDLQIDDSSNKVSKRKHS